MQNSTRKKKWRKKQKWKRVTGKDRRGNVIWEDKPFSNSLVQPSNKSCRERNRVLCPILSFILQFYVLLREFLRFKYAHVGSEGLPTRCSSESATSSSIKIFRISETREKIKIKKKKKIKKETVVKQKVYIKY